MGGVTIPLVASSVQFHPSDPLDVYTKLVQLRQLQQEGQLRQQQIQGVQQENQIREMNMQAAQRKQQESEAFRQAYSSAGQRMPNATQADLIDATTKALSGNPIVSPETIQGLQLHSQTLRQQTAAADEATLNWMQ
jgi:TolA-binding protein